MDVNTYLPMMRIGWRQAVLAAVLPVYRSIGTEQGSGSGVQFQFAAQRPLCAPSSSHKRMKLFRTHSATQSVKEMTTLDGIQALPDA